MPRILRSTPTSETSLAPFAFDDLGQHARSQLAEARGEAERIIAQAERDAEEIRGRAEVAGHQAGLERAKRDAAARLDQELNTLLPALRTTVATFEDTRTGWLVHWEQAAVKLAVAIAARVIRREVRRTPEITVALVREGLELAAGRADVQLRLHPEDAAELGDAMERIIAEAGQMGPVTLVPDATISRGGCRIDTRHGSIDQQFEAQLDRIAEELS